MGLAASYFFTVETFRKFLSRISKDFAAICASATCKTNRNIAETFVAYSEISSLGGNLSNSRSNRWANFGDLETSTRGQRSIPESLWNLRLGFGIYFRDMGFGLCFFMMIPKISGSPEDKKIRSTLFSLF